jgi:hypothetical protein
MIRASTPFKTDSLPPRPQNVKRALDCCLLFPIPISKSAAAPTRIFLLQVDLGERSGFGVPAVTAA